MKGCLPNVEGTSGSRTVIQSSKCHQRCGNKSVVLNRYRHLEVQLFLAVLLSKVCNRRKDKVGTKIELESFPYSVDNQRLAIKDKVGILSSLYR